MNKNENFFSKGIKDIDEFNTARKKFLESPIGSPEEQNTLGHYALICARSDMQEKIIQDSLLKGLPPLGEVPKK